MCRQALQVTTWILGTALTVFPFAGCASHVQRGSSTFEVLGAPHVRLPVAQTEAVTEEQSVRIVSVPVRAQAPLALPVYPPAALKAGAGEQVVHVTVTIDTLGNVTDVTPSWWRITTRGPFAEDFLTAVKAAVMSWRLSPARQIYYRKSADGEERYERTEAVAEMVEVKFVFDAKGTVR